MCVAAPNQRHGSIACLILMVTLRILLLLMPMLRLTMTRMMMMRMMTWWWVLFFLLLLLLLLLEPMAESPLISPSPSLPLSVEERQYSQVRPGRRLSPMTANASEARRHPFSS